MSDQNDPVRRRRPGAILLLALLAGGCAPNVESAVFLPLPPAPSDAEAPIRIYRGTRPPCPFDEVGLVIWKPRHGWDSLGEGVEAMRERAREMGGDAIIDFRYGERAEGVKTQTVSSDSIQTVTTSLESSRSAVGTVIRFAGPDCR